MIIHNYEIKDFGEFLMELKLKGSSSRMRMRLVRLLQDRLQLINEERNSLEQDYLLKDDNGEQVIEKDDDGNDIFVYQNREEYQNEYKRLLLEEFIIEKTPEKEDMLKEIENIVLNCDLEFSGQEAVQYDRWCEIVENK